LSKPPIQRKAARAILLTPDEQVLLMRVEVEGRSFWIAPGGGLEKGETPEEALVRELHEEVGLPAATIGPRLWRRQHTTTMFGNRWCQYEDYFLVQTSRFDPVMKDAAEARNLRAFRWWSLEDLFATEQDVTPLSLPQIVEDYLRDGAPSELDVEIIVD